MGQARLLDGIMGRMAAAELRREEIGQTVAGRYAIERLLGEGGTASVYAATDLRSNRRVALKRSQAGTQPRQRTALLEREFHTLAQLAHPTIIEVYDFGVDAHGAYYTMELLDGQDLHDQGRLPWREVCALLRDVASSLALLHARGLIHRDVSARNVRRTVDGRAKLIDFGAMTAFGVTKDVLGTPPFLAPEALQLQALDGRADLYALGALGYYLVSGVHAYPARRFRDLRDAWRSRPVALGRYQPGMPAALNDLILQLLLIDRAARPRSAAEVMQRLCAIADLPVAEDALVPQAYLSTPTLLARDVALVAVRRQMLALGRNRGKGGTLLLEGDAGSGRSRLLDACAIEAKLVGACVLRAEAAHDRGDWAAARVLVRQLVQLQPEAVEASARLSRDLLTEILEQEPPPSQEPRAPVARGPLLRELRNFFLSLAQAQSLVILVDDADRIDDASAALLAALAHKTQRHPLVIALSITRTSDDKASASLRFLRLVAEPIAVDSLVPAQTEALLRSVFGDVPGLPLVAAQIHGLSHGKPAYILEFAQHLVDKGLARYEAGTWALPLNLADGDLPQSLSARLAGRFASLSDDARELCEALCVADGDGQINGLAQYAALTRHRDRRRVFQALDELVLAHILVADPERHRFSQRGFVTVIDRTICDDRRRELHGRLADMLAELGAEPQGRASHLLACGREREALGLLDPAHALADPIPLPLLKRAVAAAVDNHLPALQIHRFRYALVTRAALDLAVDDYRRHAPIVLGELMQSSGLARYRELDSVPEVERLAQALRETEERYAATPEAERLRPLLEAIRALAGLCVATRVMATATFDRQLLEDELPALTPFSVVSPVIALMEDSARVNQLSLRGRFQLARDNYERHLESIEEREKNGQLLPEYQRARFVLHYVLGMLDASRGRQSAELHAAALQRDRSYRVNAWRIRALLNLAHGDFKEADNCRRRAELAVVREGVDHPFADTTAFSELQCYALCGDLTGIQQTNQRIARLAKRFPGWHQFLVLGQCHEGRLRGDIPGALALIEPALLEIQPGVHASYACLAACHVQLLCDSERIADARGRAEAYIEACEREQLSPAGFVMHVATAGAFARSGEFARAVEVLERAIGSARELGHGGVCIGSIYEARARLALAMQEPAQFQHYAALCAGAYGHGKHPHLAAKLAQLLAEAPGAQQLTASDVIAQANAGAIREEVATSHSRMLECSDEDERARCALTILLQHLGSFCGYLYGVNEGECVQLARLPAEDSDPAIGPWVQQLVAAELESGESSTGELDISTDSAGVKSDDGVPFRQTDARGRIFEPLFLIRRNGEEERMAAVLIFAVNPGQGWRPSRELQEDLADQLLSHGDVSGAVLPADDQFARTR